VLHEVTETENEERSGMNKNYELHEVTETENEERSGKNKNEKLD